MNDDEIDSLKINQQGDCWYMIGVDTHNGLLKSIIKPILLLQFRAPVLTHCSRHPRPSSPLNVFSTSKQQLVLEVQEHGKDN